MQQLSQAPENNSGVWENFENYCRSLVLSTDNYELLIIAGPSGFDGSRVNTNGYVGIPQFTWKIAVVAPTWPGFGVDPNHGNKPGDRNQSPKYQWG
jgi:endonuclease G